MGNFDLKQFAILFSFTLFSSISLHAQQEFLMGSADTLFTCNGFFTDSGGANGDYSANENLVTTICSDDPASGSHVRLLFRQVDLLRRHPLCFFDGTSTNAPAIVCAEDFIQNTLSESIRLPAGGSFVVQASAENLTGCITVSFNSDTTPRGGWLAEISCIPACQKIETRLISTNPAVMPADTGWINACPGEPISLVGEGIFSQEGLFYNHADSSEYIWDMGDGNIKYGPSVEHAYEESGGYTVQLTIVDQLGCTNTNFINQRVRISTKPSFNATGVVSSGCSGDTVMLDASVNSMNSNSIISVMPTEGSFFAQKIRSDSLPLPDGNGDAYTTSVKFSNFEIGSTLQDVNDLLGVCVNIEHSYLRDLEISLTCPSGKTIIMHDYPGRANSRTVFLGQPVDNDNNQIIPGTGFEYCWRPNAPNPTWIDYVRDNSSIRVLPAGDYSTFDSMDELVGCPLNGEWTITVEDLWENDNGFIFSWGLEFNPELYPDLETFTPGITSFQWEDHPSIIERNDSVIIATPDKSGEASYVFSVLDDFGCTWDTIVGVTVLPPTHADCYECEDFSAELRDTTLCSGENVALSAGPNYTEVEVSFETNPRYDQLGFPNHPPFQEYISPIEVTDVYPGTITDATIDIISVCVDIETADTDWVSDLELSLHAPDGGSLVLSTNNGGGGSNYTQTCFTPDATIPIESGTAPFTGKFIPEGNWANLNGQSMNGTWELQVADGSGPQLGIFNSWSITFNSRNGIEYTWSPADGLSCDNCATPTAQPNGTQQYEVEMTDVFGCTYSNEVTVGSVSDYSAPSVDCGITDIDLRQITFNWTDANNGVIDYEVRLDGGEWLLPNNGNLSHVVEGLSVNQTVSIEVRPFVPNIPANCDIQIATAQCLYDACALSLTASNAPIPVSCAGSTDGMLEYEIIDATTPFTLSVDGNVLSNSSQLSGIVENLAAGVHQLIVTDADACSDTLNFETLSPEAISLNALITNVKCKDGSDGSIAITTSGGTGTITTLWETGDATTLLSGLNVGSYDLIVTDEKNCQLDTSFVITEPDALSLELSMQSSSCANEIDGSALATGSGGTGTLNYLWSNGATTNQIRSLSPDTYSVTLSDANGCTLVDEIEVTSPEPLAITAIVPIDVDCKGNNTGRAIATVSGGTMPYDYLWNDPLGQNSDTAILLTAGTYELIVEDINGCRTREQVNINEPEALSVTIDFTDINCFDGTDGTATALVAGGTQPYQYQWDDLNNQTSALATELAVGTYTLTATDANGCEIIETVEIAQPDAAITAVVEQTFTSCFGAQDGEATVTISGGTGDYTYLWSNGQTGPVASNLDTTTYTVVVEDENGCTQEFNSPKIQDHPEYSININFDVPTCNGFEDGTAGATVRRGGTGTGYEYVWNNNRTGFLLENIRGGRTYTVSVTDDQGCMGVESRPLPQPDPVSVQLDSTDVACFGEATGSVNITNVSGGNLGYSYQWSANAGNATTREVRDLGVGEYSVTVTDTLGCVGFSSISIIQPEDLAVSFVVKDNSCFNGADGTITADVSGGVPSYELLWSTDARTSKITTLTSGTYTLTVTDNNGCEFISPVDVGQPESILVDIIPGEITCAGGRDGEFTVEASGGSNPYTYSIDNKSFTSNTTFLGLKSGTYDVYIKDKNGCLQTTTATLSDPPPFEVFIEPQEDFIQIEAGKATQLFANALNAGGKVEYVWTPSYPDSTLSCTECANPSVNPSSTIYYELYGIDALGCEATDRIQVRVSKDRKVMVPTGFTPNADIRNDLLLIHGTSGTRVTTFQVFDRWGELLFQADDFQINDDTIGWDGNFRGSEMPSGVYVWFAEVEYEDGMKETFKGSTQLIR